MKKIVLALTNSGDESAEPVLQHLASIDQPFFRFNTESFLTDFSFEMSMKADALEGQLVPRSGKAVSFSDIKSVWYRRPVTPWPPNCIHPGYAKFMETEASAALWSFYTTLDCYWMNNPLVSSRLLEHNKLRQMLDARAVGLRVPETLITNSSEKALAFCRSQGGRLAVKVLKGKFFMRESDNVTLFLFTQCISEEDIRGKKEEISKAPVFFQEYIDKRIELRVTVVGQKIFACAIHSQSSPRTKHDWRNYDFALVKHEPFQLPVQVESRLLQLMRNWGLNFGAIDMIVTPDGDYVFVEINPQGQWLWIEEATQMPISRAMAETLANAIGPGA